MIRHRWKLCWSLNLNFKVVKFKKGKEKREKIITFPVLLNIFMNKN